MANNGNGVDDNPVEHYYRAEGSATVSTGGDAKIDQRQYGVSERSVVLIVIVPFLASLVAVGYSFWAGGTASATATAAMEMARVQGQNAVNLAQLAERNAKLAQYQLEEALKRAGLEVPKEPEQ